MEDIFIQALAERSKKEAGLIDQLPEDVKILVEEKISSYFSNLTQEEIDEINGNVTEETVINND